MTRFLGPAALAATLAAALAATGAAHAASSAQVWQGALFVKSATAACTSAGVAAVGDSYVAVYRPIIAGSANNATNEGITLISSRSLLHYDTPTGQSFRTAGTAAIAGIGSHATAVSSSGDYSLTFTPASPTLTSKTIYFSGTLRNFWGTKNCTVGVTAAFDLRIG